MPGSFRVTLRKSPISYTAKARGTLRALGLHRIGQTVEIVDNPQTRGMARAVRFLVEVEDVEGGARADRQPAAPQRATARQRRETRQPTETPEPAQSREPAHKPKTTRRSRANEAS